MALSVRDLRAPKLHEIVRAVKLGSLASRSIGQSQISISSKVSAECSMIKQRHITHTLDRDDSNKFIDELERSNGDQS